MNRTFKVGDIIKGESKLYKIANNKMKKAIVEAYSVINPNLMIIKILDHESKIYIGQECWVKNDNEHFLLISEANETKETKEFKINDLKNGMVVEYRNGWQRVYMDEKLYKLEFNRVFTHACNDISYEENLKSKTYEKLDIVKIYKDFRGELIWERDEKEKEKEIDWSKVETDTLLKVKFFEGEDECFRYFAKYENGSIYVWINGATSLTVENKYDIVEVHSAKICK